MNAPQKSVGPAVTGPDAEQGINRFHFFTGVRPSTALATVKAQFALRGHAVHEGLKNDFTVVHKNWGHSRHCPDVAALIAFGHQVGVL